MIRGLNTEEKRRELCNKIREILRSKRVDFKLEIKEELNHRI